MTPTLQTSSFQILYKVHVHLAPFPIPLTLNPTSPPPQILYETVHVHRAGVSRALLHTLKVALSTPSSSSASSNSADTASAVIASSPPVRHAQVGGWVAV